MLNMDFAERIVIDTNSQEWVASPLAGVWRKPLAREEAERGHATSIVRYEAGASFSAHDHPLGEEILVLEGTFSDETGDYPAGTYFRNPEGFRHAPFSVEGCLILVKLHQFQKGDSRHASIDTHTSKWEETLPENIKTLPLHEFKKEQVSLVDIPAGVSYELAGGGEIYIISGKFINEQGVYPVGTWVRQPGKDRQSFYAKNNTRIWLKTGHLP